jgi:hypothetical protein
MRRIAATLLGLFLIPASAGLAVTLFQFLVGLQSDVTSTRALMFFLSGSAGWILVFVFLNRPVRLYIFSHELCHLLAAWLSGVGGGELEVRRDGGSVRVDRSSFWIALAPYVVPLYSLLVLLGFALMSGETDPELTSWLFPLLLGISWSFHLTFTLYAVSRPQSDFEPYGTFGSLLTILFLNLLLLTLTAALAQPRAFSEELRQAADTVSHSYHWTWEQLSEIKNTIFQS